MGVVSLRRLTALITHRNRFLPAMWQKYLLVALTLVCVRQRVGRGNTDRGSIGDKDLGVYSKDI